MIQMYKNLILNLQKYIFNHFNDNNLIYYSDIHDMYIINTDNNCYFEVTSEFIKYYVNNNCIMNYECKDDYIEGIILINALLYKLVGGIDD